jgi:hypothetical protein
MQAVPRLTRVSCRHPVAEVTVRSQGSAFELCGGQSGAGIGFAPSTAVFPCQYHCTHVPYSFIHLPPTLFNVFLPVLQFSLVSTIPTRSHTHSFTYNRRCIIIAFSNVIEQNI